MTDPVIRAYLKHRRPHTIQQHVEAAMGGEPTPEAGLCLGEYEGLCGPVGWRLIPMLTGDYCYALYVVGTWKLALPSHEKTVEAIAALLTMRTYYETHPDDFEEDKRIARAHFAQATFRALPFWRRWWEWLKS